MTVAVVPASFDPIQRGHVDIITRASRLFDRVVVGVYARPRKNVMFSLDERIELVRESLDGLSLDGLSGVEVRGFEGLTVDFARTVGANVVVRGLRFVSDFESEFQQATLNRRMAPELEVVCMFSSSDHIFVSSTIIKEIAENGGDVSTLVPPPVARRLAERIEFSAPPGR